MMVFARRLAALAVCTALTLGALACSETTRPNAEPPVIPSNNTPENTVLRFIGMYSTMNLDEYGKLLTGDFEFDFSNAADPNLVTQYASGWGKAHELQSAKNLFEGGTNATGYPVEAALTISVLLTPATPAADSASGRDPVTHATLLSSIDVTIDLPSDNHIVIGQAPPHTNRFFLVRGDAAVGLGSDQPADADHWYIWLWRDESPLLGKPNQPQNSTWGRVKGFYY